MKNLTEITSFLLIGLSDRPSTISVLFVAFLHIYLMTLIINLLIIYLVFTDSQLHNPMIQTKFGKMKAFSTCTSHLAVVFIFYGSIIFIYFIPTTSNLFTVNRVVSVLYALVNPLLNPLIYSIRNKDLKRALLKALQCLNKLNR
ncbi:hypothetical protein AB205_0016220 [Aquarana catesbeiana]|uniref:G-protein coupled receptors family 1 profile domain-containing protein n=1 Tax=Aquarana catesbeiana TaxID=8400 RepID=A0A2G9QB20_AQUCT|nr:hypothetical protein AB205_0016220 [Aquarana catesbeiana]